MAAGSWRFEVLEGHALKEKDEKYVKESKHGHRWRCIVVNPLLIICLLVVVAPPVLIDYLFNMGESHPIFYVPWTSGEILNYCGTLAAAAIAIIGVVYTLREDRQQREMQMIDESAPFFAAAFLTPENKRTLLFEDSRANGSQQDVKSSEHECASLPEYVETEKREVYVLFGNDVEYRRRLDDVQKERVQSSFVQEQPTSGVVAYCPNPVIYLPIKMRNIGRGAATGVRVGVNRPKDDWKGVCCWTLDHGDEFYLGLYVDTDIEGSFGDYEIRIVFSDCLGYQYMQTFELHVVKDSNSGDNGKSSSMVQVSFVGERSLLSGEDRKTYLVSVRSLADKRL